MFHKKNWFIFVLIVCTLPVYGQGNLLKNGIKTVLPRQRVEISPAMGFAAVDNKTQRAVLQDLHGLDGILKGRASGCLLDWRLDNYEGKSFWLMDSALPGFEMDWTVALEQYAQNHDGRNFFEDMMPVLQSIYPGARFTPQYAGSFADVLAFSRQPGHTGVRLGKALLKAWQNANLPEHMPGFAVVRVEGKGNRPKDVLILDIAQEKAFSLFKSQGFAVAQEYKSIRKSWARWHKKAARRLQEQGFVINERKNLISKDGVIWADLNTLPNKQALLYAWKNGFHVRFERSGWSGKADYSTAYPKPQKPAPSGQLKVLKK